MKEQLSSALQQLITYAREKDIAAEFFCHGEQSALMRFAQSAVSLNSTTNTLTLTVTVYRGNACGTAEITTRSDDIDGMKNALHMADDIAAQATPTHYDRSFTPLPALPDDTALYDPALPATTADELLAFSRAATEDMPHDLLALSGMITTGAIQQATANTLSDTILFHAMADASATLCLQHIPERWELSAGHSAVRKDQLNPADIKAPLSTLLSHYMSTEPIALTPEKYTVVFGADALAHLLQMFLWIGVNGGMAKRKMTFLKEEHLGTRVFDPRVSLTDDPNMPDTFPYAFDLNGHTRAPFPLIQNGVFHAYTWSRDDADEFGQKETGHSVPSMSLVMNTGDTPCATLEDLIALPRESDVLYLPHLHYMNVVNPSQGVVTCSSRFGALLLRKDGRVDIPYNVRMTESLLKLFSQVDWIAQDSTVVNTSNSYGTRNPNAVCTPTFMQVNNVNITHANTSF